MTGAARGIGAASVRRLARAKWAVVAVDVCKDDPGIRYPLASRQDMDQLVEECGENVVPIIGDVRDLETLVEAVSCAKERFGGLDAAIGAAGIILGGDSFWTGEPRELDILFDVNVRGVANLARTAIPALLERPSPRSGRFIVIASGAAHTGLPRLAAYCASKHAVLGLVRGLSRDLATTGITSNVVSPGSTRTAMLEESARLYELADLETFSEHQSVGRIIEPEEIAESIAWLVSEHSSAVNGAEIRVDGGFIG